MGVVALLHKQETEVRKRFMCESVEIYCLYRGPTHSLVYRQITWLLS